jgi:branched-chain amino acid transport system permease protein/urea transport system permease protein
MVRLHFRDFIRSTDFFRALVFGLLLFFPLVGDDYFIAQLTQYLVYGIFAISLSLVWGYGGILCFGHAIFFGLGAYVMGLATKGMIPGISGILATSLMGIILSVVVVALFAVVLGYFLFYGRLSGPYLGIVTLAMAVIAERIAVKWYYIGGYNGLINVPPLSIAGWEIISINTLFYVILAIGTGVYLVCNRIVRSPFGTIMAAVRDNEMRAEFFGYNIPSYKIIIFAVGAAVAGLAGALFAAVTEFVSPTMLGFGFSTEVLIWVALGGKEVLLASFLGALLVRVLESYLSDLLTYYWILILGLFFVFCVMFFPKGVFGSLLSEKRRS